MRSKVVETKLKWITKTLRKECSTIRLQKRYLFHRDPVKIRENVLQFLEDERLLALMETYMAKEEMSEQEQLMSRRFLMSSLIYCNAQRQGPVTNMTLDEQSRVSSHTTRSEEVVWVYRVFHFPHHWVSSLSQRQT